MADDQIAPAEAVRAYHADLERHGHPAAAPAGGRSAAKRHGRQLQRDPPTRPVAAAAKAGARPTIATHGQSMPPADAEPDFSKMSPAEKAQWNLEALEADRRVSIRTASVDVTAAFACPRKRGHGTQLALRSTPCGSATS